MTLFLLTYLAAGLLVGMCVKTIDKIDPSSDHPLYARVTGSVICGLFWPLFLFAVLTLGAVRVVRRLLR